MEHRTKKIKKLLQDLEGRMDQCSMISRRGDNPQFNIDAALERVKLNHLDDNLAWTDDLTLLVDTLMVSISIAAYNLSSSAPVIEAFQACEVLIVSATSAKAKVNAHRIYSIFSQLVATNPCE